MTLNTSFSEILQGVGLDIASVVKIKESIPFLGVHLFVNPPLNPPQTTEAPCWGIHHHPNLQYEGVAYPWSIWVFAVTATGEINREIHLLEYGDCLGVDVAGFNERLKIKYPNLYPPPGSRVATPRRATSGGRTGSTRSRGRRPDSNETKENAFVFEPGAFGEATEIEEVKDAASY